MSEDHKKWKGLNGPLPGKNARSDPAKQAPKPTPEPVKLPRQEWRPGNLPLSQPRAEARPQEAGQFNQQLPRQHQAGGDSDAMQSVLPIRADHPQEEAMPTMVEERNRLWWLPLLGFGVVGGIILLVALSVMQQPLSNMTQAHAYSQQKTMIEARQQADYAALDADVHVGIRQVQHALMSVSVRNQRIAADAELRIGQPLQVLQSSPRERPRELNLAILESKDNAANWASLVSATNPTQLRAIAMQVAELEARARDGKLIPSDRHAVAGLLTRAAQQEELAGKRASQAQRLMESLEAQKLEMSLTSAERK